VKQPVAAALMTLILLGSTATADDSGWNDAGSKRGMRLAFRDDPVLDTREARATAELPFAAHAVFAVVCDFSLYGELVDGVTEATLIEGSVPTEYDVYLRYAPRYVVVAARDVVLRVRGESDPTGGHSCSWTEVTGRVAERKGVVRMPVLRGGWRIEALSETRSRVVYHVAAKPGGRIPDWLVRRGAVNALPDVIERVHERLRSTH
jgi:ribosome-associated toxin RatA of RatAB toxin-antitoxin module